MKMAMLKIEQEIPEADQILQIHDSILMECDPMDAKKVGEKMRDIMENIYPKIGVKLRVDVKTGQSWADL
jgi:DNA polymerase I-like protein with 3'-5' exonuclease and polymerase domains